MRSNLTGDAFHADQDGFLWYHSRTDDMIVSSGYNISGQEIEEVLLEHPRVKECAVVGIPYSARGQIAKAFIVLRVPDEADEDLAIEDVTIEDLAIADLAIAIRRLRQKIDRSLQISTGRRIC